MHKQAIIQKLSELSEDIGLETALFQEKVAAKASLTVNDMRALSIIMKYDGIGATILSKKLAVTNGAVTGIVDRLEKKGYIRRETSKEDLRKTIIRANYPEIEADSNDYQDIGQVYQELLESYSLGELQVILGYSLRILEITKQQSAQVDKLAP